MIDFINQIIASPIELSNGCKVKIVVASCVCDNPASIELHGICRSFLWNACKYCQIYLDEIVDFNRQRLDAEERVMNSDRIFNQVAYRGILFAPDVFHDLNEGIYSPYLSGNYR